MRGKREAGSREEAGRISTLSSSGASINVSSSGLTQGSRNKESRKGDESGRSMVEMLGVLAIMGVLAVGGIAGYRYAMDKYQANEIINEVKKRAVVISQQLAVGGSVETPEFKPETEQGYGVEQVLLDDGFFSIIVSDVPQGVCARIVETEWALPVAMYAGSVMAQGEGSICQENNRMQFEFTDDLRATNEKPEHCTKKSDCSSKCDDCIDGVCLENCPAGQACVRSSTGNVSVPDLCCPLDRIMNGTCCASITYNDQGEKLCCQRSNMTSCCPEGEFMWNGQCHNCDDPTDLYGIVVNFYRYSCDMCPNRVSAGWQCLIKCKEADQVVWRGRCLCPDERPVMGQDGICRPCGSNGVWSSASSVSTVHEMDSCGVAAWCGNMYCSGGYVWACAPGKISGVNALKIDGSAAGGGGWACFYCNELQLDKLKYKAQCESCGGTWSGAWNDGTCSP